MKNVLVLLPLNEEQKARLESLGPDCRFAYSSETAVTEEQIRQVVPDAGYEFVSLA